MKTDMRVSKLTYAAAAVLMTLAFGACSETTDIRTTVAPTTQKFRMDSVTKLYESVDVLAKDSTVAVLGTLEKVLDKAVDNGGIDGSDGTPMVLYSLRVERHSDGVDLPESIRLAYIDTDRVEAEDVEPLRLGGRYVFFLEARTRATAPGLKEWVPLFIPTGANAGVFEVDQDGSAVAVSGDLRSLRAGGGAAPRERNRLAVPAVEPGSIQS